MNSEPTFVNGNFKWYFQKEINKYISTKQAANLPILENLACFIVINESENINDYVLINEKQQVVKNYNNSLEGHGQLMAYINMLKISMSYEYV